MTVRKEKIKRKYKHEIKMKREKNGGKRPGKRTLAVGRRGNKRLKIERENF